MAETLYEQKVLRGEVSGAEEAELRRLWRTAFEDDADYQDFYHNQNLRHNRIWTLWDGERLIAMLHANPYRIWVNGTLFPSYYIVGVATDPAYRRRGCMGRLMNAALHTFEREGVDFVYLVPDKEAYYLPFGFRVVGTQHVWEFPIKEEAVVWEAHGEKEMLPGFPGLPGSAWFPGKLLSGTGKLPGSLGLPGDAAGLPARAEYTPDIVRGGGLPERRDLLEGGHAGAELAEFANHWLKKRVPSFTWRDEAYYQKRAAECRSMGGDMYLLLEDGKLAGVASMGREKGQLVMYDVVGDALLEALEQSEGWRLVENQHKVMLNWLGENNRIGNMLPFHMEELV